MASRRSNNSPEAMELSGHWWLPGQEDVRIGGTLAFTPGSGGALKLLGELAEEPPEGMQVILGFAGGKSVTLLAAYWQRSRRQNGHAEEEWGFFSMLEGASYEEPDTARFPFSSITTEGLGSWAVGGRVTGFRGAEETLGKETLVYQSPEDVDIAIPEMGSLTLWWSTKVSYGSTSGSIEVTPRIDVNPEGSLSLDELWKNVVTPLLFFLMLASGQEDRLRDLRLQPESEGQLPSPLLTWHTSSWSGDGGATGWRPVLPFDSYGERLPSILPKWFELFRIHRAAMLEVFDPLASGVQTSMEENFLRLARAVESFHRVRFGGTILAKDHFKGLVRRVTQVAVDEDEEDLIGMRFSSYANEVTFRSRVSAVLEQAGPLLSGLMSQYPKFAQRVVATRNEITHQSPNKNAYQEAEMFYASRGLALLLKELWMRELEIAQTEIDGALERTSDWSILRAAGSVL